jgi:hypothetical protein
MLPRRQIRVKAMAAEAIVDDIGVPILLNVMFG